MPHANESDSTRSFGHRVVALLGEKGKKTMIPQPEAAWELFKKQVEHSLGFSSKFRMGQARRREAFVPFAKSNSKVSLLKQFEVGWRSIEWYAAIFSCDKNQSAVITEVGFFQPFEAINKLNILWSTTRNLKPEEGWKHVENPQHSICSSITETITHSTLVFDIIKKWN